MKVIKLRRKWVVHPHSGAKKGYVRTYHPIIKWAETAGPLELLEVECNEKRKYVYIRHYLKEKFPEETFKILYYQKTNGQRVALFKKEERGPKKRVRVGRPKNKARKKKVLHVAEKSKRR